LKRTRYDKNEIVIYDNYAEVILYDNSNNEKARALIGLEDIDKVKDFKWRLSITNGVGYVKNATGIYLHRLVMDCPKNMLIDHIFHNTLDNRKSQLRICTKRENQCSQKVNTKNTSGVKGVCWDKSRNKWMASIKHNGKHIFLGRFNNKELAIKVREDAAKKYFKEFTYNEGVA
jgi:hypothetical protein